MSVEVKAYTPKELKALYGETGRPVSRKTWASWLSPFRDELGELLGKFYTPQQVKLIFEKLGPPRSEIE